MDIQLQNTTLNQLKLIGAASNCWTWWKVVLRSVFYEMVKKHSNIESLYFSMYYISMVIYE